jgi:hypothetical protein
MIKGNSFGSKSVSLQTTLVAQAHLTEAQVLHKEQIFNKEK